MCGNVRHNFGGYLYHARIQLPEHAFTHSTLPFHHPLLWLRIPDGRQSGTTIRSSGALNNLELRFLRMISELDLRYRIFVVLQLILVRSCAVIGVLCEHVDE